MNSDTHISMTRDKIKGAWWLSLVLVIAFLSGVAVGMILVAVDSHTSRAIKNQAAICSACPDDQQACVAEWWSAVEVIERCAAQKDCPSCAPW